MISGRQIESTDDIIEASKAVYDKYGCPVLSKGGHFTDTACVCDYLWDGKQIITFETKEWIIQTHTAQVARFHQR